MTRPAKEVVDLAMERADLGEVLANYAVRYLVAEVRALREELAGAVDTVHCYPHKTSWNRFDKAYDGCVACTLEKRLTELREAAEALLEKLPARYEGDERSYAAAKLRALLKAKP